MKVHRYELRLAGLAHTVLALRPSDPVRFSTNYFHETWHVLSDLAGAAVFHDVCWMMAYQRKRGTVFLFDQRHLCPNPFDADPANPIMVVNSDLATPDRRHITALKRHLPLRRQPDGTVKNTNVKLREASEAKFEEMWDGPPNDAMYNEHRRRPFIERVNGVIVIAATPEVLMQWSRFISTRPTVAPTTMEYWELDAHYGPEGGGELQVFDDFDAMVKRAAARREEFLPGTEHRAMTDAERVAYQHWASDRSKAEAATDDMSHVSEAPKQS